MNPQEIINHLQQLGRDMDSAKNRLYKASVAKAEAEKAYRVELATKIIKLKAGGEKVTVISDLAKGDEKVAELKLERDKQEAIYDACKYEINSLKERISIGQSSLSWLKTEYQMTTTQP